MGVPFFPLCLEGEFGGGGGWLCAWRVFRASWPHRIPSRDRDDGRGLLDERRKQIIWEMSFRYSSHFVYWFAFFYSFISFFLFLFFFFFLKCILLRGKERGRFVCEGFVLRAYGNDVDAVSSQRQLGSNHFRFDLRFFLFFLVSSLKLHVTR